MKFKINMDYINKNFIKKIGRDKLILICGAVAVLIICLIWEEKNDKASDKQYADSGVLNNENDSRDKFGIYMEKYVREQEEKLKSILSRIDGVGEVYVMITVKTGASKDILMEQDISYEDTDETDSSGGKRKKYTYSEDNQTVYVTDENGNTYPYVISEKAPKIEGVAVIAKGADSAVTRQKIINVIKALFDIEVNKISVE
ncbi:MAG: hypothetical protein K1W00_09315 [Lachnospiraceae bacterium]